MISIETLRRYPFFAGLSHEYLVTLSKTATQLHFEADQPIFHEGDELTSFYLVLEGTVGIVIAVTDREYAHKLADQLVGNLNMKGVTTSTVKEGQVFGWSALVPPHTSTAGAKAITSCRVVAFDCEQLRPRFDEDPRFAYKMVLKAAQIIRERLRDLRVESLSEKLT